MKQTKKMKMYKVSDEAEKDEEAEEERVGNVE